MQMNHPELKHLHCAGELRSQLFVETKLNLENLFSGFLTYFVKLNFTKLGKEIPFY